MSQPERLDIAELRRLWDVRRDALRNILRRFDTRGMTRPARDSAEREWIVERDEAWFVEDPACAEAAREYYARRYGR